MTGDDTWLIDANVHEHRNLHADGDQYCNAHPNRDIDIHVHTHQDANQYIYTNLYSHFDDDSYIYADGYARQCSKPESSAPLEWLR